MADSGRPNARYRPRGLGFLVFERAGRRIEIPLDADSTDIPPPADERLAAPPARARIERMDAGHTISPLPGASVQVNHRPIARRTVLHGGDTLDIDNWSGQYTAAREELNWPITIVIWPPEGAPVEIRSHRARLTIGAGDSDVQVDDDTLDGQHCTIRRFANGVMTLSDDKSYNGVFIDTRKVVESANLRDGAEVRIGRTRLKAWAEASVRPDGHLNEPVDSFDGIPDGGFDPNARPEPLRPYAVELGPDYVQTRRRTFADDVPTRLEGLGETVDVRKRRRSGDKDGYRDEPRRTAAQVPDWAPAAVNKGPSESKQADRPLPKRRSDETDYEEGLEFGRKKAHNLTLVHPGDTSRRDPHK